MSIAGCKQIILLATVVSLATGCTDKPPKPQPVEYVVYNGVSATGDLYVLDADSLTIIDSIPGVGYSVSMVTSSDGRWLYAQNSSRPGHPYLKKIDTKSRQVLDSLVDSRFASELTSLDGGNILLRGLDFCRREVIDPNTLSISQTINDTICPIRGPSAGMRVAAVVNGESRLRLFDVESGTLAGEYIVELPNGTPLTIIDAVLHEDQTRVLVLGWQPGIRAWFLIGSLVSGQTLLAYPLVYPEGTIAINESGDMAAVTDPSRFGIWDSYPTVDLFDLDSLTLLKHFYAGPGGEMMGFVRDVAFLPGTDLLIGAPGPRASQGDEIHVFDIRALKVLRVVEPGYSSLESTSMCVGVKQ